MTTGIWVAGHRGMVGSAVTRRLEKDGRKVLKVDRRDLDLRDQTSVTSWLCRNKPEAIVFAAAKVGGIFANNTYPADFLYDNLAIETNIIHGAHLAGINRLVFLGSSCIYPKYAAQPIEEASLLTGALEPTNEWYAVAKIAGIKLCQAYRKQYNRSYISVMPCNLYGPGDNFDLSTSHVLPALIRKCYEAKINGDKKVEVWGTGTPLREFLHVDDLAEGVVFCLNNYDGFEHINCGAGKEISIADLASIVKEIVDFSGSIVFDHTKPDGTPRKLMDSTRLNELGWRPRIDLRTGIKDCFAWFLEAERAGRQVAA